MIGPVITARSQLSKPQVRILRFLESLEGGFATEATICQEARVEEAWLPKSLFSRHNIHNWDGKPILEATNDGIAREIAQGYKVTSLLTRKLVSGKSYKGDGNTERVWTITELGKQAFNEYMEIHNSKRKKPKKEELVDVE